ncbi:MAG TPA: LysR family transcriptional regulator [Gemmatimonadales bacterium]|nr:LysR family transcriptional regulator [Gemmatimonadales bacterium]
MIFKNLQYLEALAHEQHFARAAARCGVTQPTLSAGIKQLEEELGVLVVQRGQRFQGFTPEGARVLDWAHRILADIESLNQEVSLMKAGLTGRLRIGAIPVALPIVSLVTGPFALQFPQVAITVHSMTSIEIQRGLDDFSLDAGLTYLDNEPLQRVRALEFYRERYYLFTPAEGTLAGQESISWKEAAETHLCLLTPDMQNRRIVDGHFQEAGASVAPMLETNSILTLCGHLRSGRWSTVLPQAFLYLLNEIEHIRAIPLSQPTPTHSVGLVVPDREPLTPSGRELLRVAGTLDIATAVENQPLPA